MRKLILLVLALFILTASAYAGDVWVDPYTRKDGTYAQTPVPVGKNLKLVLELKSDRVVVGRPVRLRLMVVNEGKSSVRLVHLYAGELEIGHSFFGWAIDINGPGGEYKFIALPTGVPFFTEDRIIELKPGESFGTEIDVTQAALLRGKEPPFQRLGQTEGNYVVKVSYHWQKPYYGDCGGDQFDLFLGPISSEPLEFSLAKEK